MLQKYIHLRRYGGIKDGSPVQSTAPAKDRLLSHFASTSLFFSLLSRSVPVYCCCSLTSSNKWVQTGMWYRRQCSWYFLSGMSRFPTERRRALWQIRKERVRGHSGMGSKDTLIPSKWQPSCLQLWKRDLHSISTCPAPQWVMLAMILKHINIFNLNAFQDSRCFFLYILTHN